MKFVGRLSMFGCKRMLKTGWIFGCQWRLNINVKCVWMAMKVGEVDESLHVESVT